MQHSGNGHGPHAAGHGGERRRHALDVAKVHVPHHVEGLVRRLRAEFPEAPLVFYTYYNLVFANGVDAYVAAAAAARARCSATSAAARSKTPALA